MLLGVAAVSFPNFALFKFTLYADFINGLFLPIIFFFLYKFANDREIMGKYRNNHIQNVLLIGSGLVITIASLVGGVGKAFGM